MSALFPMPTAESLAKRIVRCEEILSGMRSGGLRPNGEYAMQLECDIASYRVMLAKVIALTGGATCASC